MLRHLVALTTERAARDGLWPGALTMPQAPELQRAKLTAPPAGKPMQMLSNTCGFAAAGLQNHAAPRTM